MLAKRLDPIDAYRQRAYPASSVYRRKLRKRKLSIHARFVAQALDVFPGSSILENVPASEQGGLSSEAQIQGGTR